MARPVQIHVITSPECPHCPEAIKRIQKLMTKYKGVVEMDAIDAESAAGHELVEEYGIQGVPTILVNGKLFTEGVPKMRELEKAIAWEIEHEKEISRSFI